MKRFLALLLVACGLALIPGPAVACSCGPGSDEGYVLRADVIVDATLVRIRRAEVNEFNQSPHVLKVHRTFKGEPSGRVEFLAATNEGGCGLAGFGLGDRATFFLSKNNGSLSSGLCSGNGAVTPDRILPYVDAAADAPDLITDRVMDEEDGLPLGPTLGLIAAGLLASFVGLGVLWHRRRFT